MTKTLSPARCAAVSTIRRGRPVAAFPIAACLFISLAAAAPAAAQDAGAASGAASDAAALEAELFADSQDGSGTDAAPGLLPAAGAEVARTEYLVGGVVAVQAIGYFPSTLDELYATAGVSGKLLAKVSVPDYGSLFVAYNASHQLAAAYTGGGTAPRASDPYAPEFELAELHYSFDVGKALFVRIGNQLVSWGPSRIWSPVDFINLEKEDAFSSVDLRVGKPGLRLHVPFRGGNAFLFADLDGLITESGALWLAGDPVETVNLGGRLDFTAAGFEFGLSGYGGKNARAKLGLDASGRLLGSTVYGELALAPAYGDYEFASQASAGLSRSLGELKKWSLSLEGLYNSTGRDLSGYTAATILALPASERASLYQGEWYAYAALAGDDFPASRVKTTLSGIANLSDGSYSIKLSGALSLPRSVPFTLTLSYAGGGDDKEFTRYSGDKGFGLSALTRMEF